MRPTSKTELNVLVVEDDATVRETLGMVLEAYQYKPILVESGRKAFEFLAEYWPDVMLLDLTLQEMSGEDVYSEILARFGKVPPTIVLSAVQHGDIRASHLPGARFLAKPYTIEELVEIINEASESRAA
jgi:DNA-binding response OmpR family regulator